MSVDSIRDEILSLPPQERIRLIDILWESLSPSEIKLREKAWAAESERRIDAVESGLLRARDAADVCSDLRKRVKK